MYGDEEIVIEGDVQLKKETKEERNARFNRAIKDYEFTLENLYKKVANCDKDMSLCKEKANRYMNNSLKNKASAQEIQVKIDHFMEGDLEQLYEIRNTYLLAKEKADMYIGAIVSSYEQVALLRKRLKKKIDAIEAQIDELRYKITKDRNAKKRAEYARRCDYKRLPHSDCIAVLPRRMAFVGWLGISRYKETNKFEGYAHIDFLEVKEEDIVSGRVICINGEFYRGCRGHYIVHRRSNDYYRNYYSSGGKRVGKELTDEVAVDFHEVFSILTTNIKKKNERVYNMYLSRLAKLLTAMPRMVAHMPLYLFDGEDLQYVVKKYINVAIGNVAEGLRSLNRDGEHIKPYRNEINDKYTERRLTSRLRRIKKMEDEKDFVRYANWPTWKPIPMEDVYL